MWSWKAALSLGTVANLLGLVNGVTVYYIPGQAPLSAATASAATYTGAAAYNPTVLTPPPVPTDLPKSFTLQLVNGGTAGASIPVPGRFFGFSIEMSVVNQVLGKNASFIQVPFLNLMGNLAQRSGGVQVRVGGNTQETAVLVDSTPDGRILEKNLTGVTNPTQTPPLIFTPEFLYLMSNISSLVNVHWHIGVPFFNVPNFNLDIAVKGRQILGDRLIGIQVANEPDLYVNHLHRPQGYNEFNYADEFGELVQAMSSDPNEAENMNILIGPNIATEWTPEQVWNTGFVDRFSSNLAFLAVERYPSDNCFAQFGVGVQRNPQDVFPTYLTHAAGQGIVSSYLNSTAFAQTKGKPFMMFETNTASCGGFPGVSDSFGAALWGLDYAMTMAYSNFSGALFHVGGQNVFYNPFTPPPTNQSDFHQWTIGPIYYSALVVAEAIGSSNNSQVLDLQANGANQFTPAYSIYEGGNPVRVLLINFNSDPSGNSDVTASIAIGGGQTGQPSSTPASVKVKYLRADSIAQKANLTWANQTFGDHFASDGRPMGTEEIVTVPCDQNAGVCNIVVFAPSAALVFLSDSAMTENDGAPATTYATTARTKLFNTVTIDPAVVSTSNGHKGLTQLGSTSKGSVSGATGLKAHIPGLSVVFSMVLGAIIILGRKW
ncbi:glycoside hydrolase family 79 protein [Macrolepiota fuliginosa MF-IS2]|uniref:Glycoside hydrolase family 79 protein n=1 Tax=Macrolepiota fuliginosa MF-IS2 TaxID=1400762 RepID=A0A9P5XGF2_9AGAR|nr:glycoside hydrolase family 79 protein [Macrolepiota fuliginosa MF-IS2]